MRSAERTALGYTTLKPHSGGPLTASLISCRTSSGIQDALPKSSRMSTFVLTCRCSTWHKQYRVSAVQQYRAIAVQGGVPYPRANPFVAEAVHLSGDSPSSPLRLPPPRGNGASRHPPPGSGADFVHDLPTRAPPPISVAGLTLFTFCPPAPLDRENANSTSSVREGGGGGWGSDGDDEGLSYNHTWRAPGWGRGPCMWTTTRRRL